MKVHLQQHVLVGPESSNTQTDEPRALKRKQDELVQEVQCLVFLEKSFYIRNCGALSDSAAPLRINSTLLLKKTQKTLLNQGCLQKSGKKTAPDIRIFLIAIKFKFKQLIPL